MISHLDENTDVVQDNHHSLLGILKLFPPERPHFTQTPIFPAMALRDRKQANIWTTDFETTHMARQGW